MIVVTAKTEAGCEMYDRTEIIKNHDYSALMAENAKLREDIWNLIRLFRQVRWCCDEYKQYVPKADKNKERK